MPPTPARRDTARRLALGVVAGLALPAAVALPASPAAAQTAPSEALTHYTYFDCYTSGIHRSMNGPGPIDETRSGGGDVVRARVDPEQQLAGSSVRSDYDPDGAVRAGSGCYTTGAFDNVYTVTPGTSGLAPGDPVTLVAEVDVDAEMDEYTDNSRSYTTEWRFSAYYGVYSIVDCPPPDEDDGDGGGDEGEDGGSSCEPEVQLAEFESSEHRSVDGSMPSAYDPNGSWSYRSYFDYEIFDNAGQYEADSKTVQNTLCEAFPCTLPVDPTQPVPLGPVQPRKDRAVLTIETEVGERLKIRGSINLKTFAGGGEVTALANALDGLQADVSPAADSAGVVLAPGEVDVEVPEPDTTAPAVTATTSAPANEAGWHREDVTVSFTATDDVAPTSTSYRIGAGEPVVTPGATASVPVTTEGATTLTYWASDAAGNSSAPQEVVVQLDKTAPTLVVPSDTTLDATSAAGRVWDYDVHATDGDVALTPTCTPPPGSVFPVGTSTIDCQVSDVAGNTSRADVEVTVRPFVVATPGERVTALRGAVQAVPDPAAAKPLSAKLGVVLKELSGKGKPANACKHLQQFESMTAQRSGRQLDPATATRLIAESAAIREALC